MIPLRNFCQSFVREGTKIRRFGGFCQFSMDNHRENVILTKIGDFVKKAWNICKFSFSTSRDSGAQTMRHRGVNETRLAKNSDFAQKIDLIGDRSKLGDFWGRL